MAELSPSLFPAFYVPHPIPANFPLRVSLDCLCQVLFLAGIGEPSSALLGGKPLKRDGNGCTTARLGDCFWFHGCFLTGVTQLRLSLS
jgi:hypothetical protein